MYLNYNGVTIPRVRFDTIASSTIYEGFMPVGISKSWECLIYLHGANTAAINVAIAAIEQVFSVHGGVARMLDRNGRPTAHVLGDGQSRAGCRVVKPPSYEPAIGIEMGTRRSVRVGLQADYDVRIPNLVVGFSETVSIQGDGGPDIRYKANVIGRPTRLVLRQYTPVRVTQSGSITGRYRLVYPEEYVTELFPGFRNGPECSFNPGTAQERHGVPGRPVERNFPCTYTWVYNLPGQVFVKPNGWRY